MSIASADGTFGSPGIVITSPVNATMNPAPIDGLNSLTVIVNPSGLPNNLGFRGSNRKKNCL